MRVAQQFTAEEGETAGRDVVDGQPDQHGDAVADGLANGAHDPQEQLLATMSPVVGAGVGDRAEGVPSPSPLQTPVIVAGVATIG